MLDISGTHIPLNEADIYELEKMLSIPLGYIVLKVLELEHCYELLAFLPWDNQASGKVFTDVCQI